MRSLKMLIMVLGVLGLLGVPHARADEWNKKTTVTFKEPVEIPGKVLPAGTYVFRLMDSSSDRNVVQIFNSDQSELFATILAIPDYRQNPTGKAVINFEERPKGAPEAVESWFYPGDNFGQEFVYPKSRAMELAKATHHQVLSMPTEMAVNVSKHVKSVAEEPVVAMKKAPIKAIRPTGEEVDIAKAITPAPPSVHLAAAQPTAHPTTHKAKQLPHTASSLPVIATLGLLALGVGGMLGALLKKRRGLNS
jgi:uncharacterized surface anchored protein